MKLPSRVSLIWAQSSNDVIGRKGEIPSEFLSDLSHFKKLTNNHTVIMGRKTWESLPVKPLPNRVNVVLTSDPHYKVPEGVKVIQSLDDLVVETEALFFIGGTEVYNLGFPYANEIYITFNHVSCSGDTYAPYFDEVAEERNGWKVESHEKTSCPVTQRSHTKFFFKKRKEDDHVQSN